MIARPTFDSLESNYRILPTQVHACTMVFPNTCAIRMSEALVATCSGFKTVFKKSGRNLCPHGYVRGAQDLGAILQNSSGFGGRDIGFHGMADGEPPASIAGKKGVICYMKIPGFSGQGHIDLWDGSQPVGQAYWDAATIWMWILK